MRRALFASLLAALAGCSDPSDAPVDGASPFDATVDHATPDACDCSNPDTIVLPKEDASVDLDAGASMDGAPTACPPLTLEPELLRIATGSVAGFRTHGGSGRLVLFRALPEDGGLRGTSLSLGGSVVAGNEATRFDVIAEDGTCDLRARARVEVVGPMRVEPSFARVRPGTGVRFTVSGTLGSARWTPLTTIPVGVGRLDESTMTFNSGSTPGTATWIVHDTASSQEVSVTVQVALDAELRPRVPVLLVPAGRRARLDWTGGSTQLDVSITSGTTGGALVREGDHSRPAPAYHPETPSSPHTPCPADAR